MLIILLANVFSIRLVNNKIFIQKTYICNSTYAQRFYRTWKYSSYAYVFGGEKFKGDREIRRDHLERSLGESVNVIQVYSDQLAYGRVF